MAIMFQKLAAHDGKITQHIDFTNFLMRGWMRKKVDESSMFSFETFPKRYYYIDFNSAIL